MISVIVCTYNRADKLQNLLASLTQMTVPPGLAWELIVVDNNSTDGTAQLLAEAEAHATLPLRRLFERRPGLAIAHNTALGEAKGDVIAFTDDDCRVDPNWLAVVDREFRDPAVALLGGRVELFNAADHPTSTRVGRARLDLTDDASALDILIGCNMAFRRATALAVGAFDTRFGAGCKVVPSADDSDFVYRMLRAGGRMIYAPDLMVLHDHGRRTDAQVGGLRRNYLRGRGALYAKYMLRRDRRMTRLAYWEVGRLALGALRPLEGKADRFALANLFAGAASFVRHRGAGGELPPKSP
jgi:glycosyltransferase involved in cell wall biosynthesis